MAQLSESNLRDMQNAAAQILVGGGAAALTAQDVPDDIKTFFCAHWDEVKALLQYIADKVGGIAGWAVRAIIAAGDVLKGSICG
ncbi:MAG TPA: hypothetical protein VFW19_01855 [Allosphingosinicella sp.]|nr:hypothetical protein [Allosphingosinicella sp.]